MQPKDEGIICLLKAKYHSLVLRRLILSLEKKASMPALSILSAMMWLLKAWNTLPDKTFTNCFRKCRISEGAATSDIADDDNPIVGFTEDN